MSVVLPIHDRASMLGRAITSALNQTIRDLEVIVVDDGSTDHPELVVHALGDPRIRFLRIDERQGACVARNTGLAAARGEFVAFLDSDDEWVPDKLLDQLTAIDRSDLENVAIVTCGEAAVRANGRRTVTLPSLRGWIFDDLLRQSPIGCRTSNLLVRRSVLVDHRIHFDPRLPARQDWDFVVQVARVAQMEIVRRPLTLVHHHSGERVWTPARAVEAGNYLHEKYQEDLRGDRRAHARFHLRIALTCMAAGDRRGAIEQIRGALEADPRGPLSYPWLLLAVLQREGRKPSLVQRVGIKLLRPLTF